MTWPSKLYYKTTKLLQKYFQTYKPQNFNLNKEAIHETSKKLLLITKDSLKMTVETHDFEYSIEVPHNWCFSYKKIALITLVLRAGII